jgi:hypothetical protein
MFKKISLLLVVILIPAVMFASGGTITRDSRTYQDIKSLVDDGVITKPLTKESLSRDEAVEYINNGVHNMLAANTQEVSSASDAALMGQIDKLYNLVKAYMTDMMKTQQKLDSILETIGDLKVKKDNIEKRQDKLLNAMGMRINGESSAYMTDLLLYGSKYSTDGAPDQRYRPITQYLDLKFSLRATKELYSEATFRVENVYGGFWGSQDIYGLRRFFIQGEYPVSFIIGDYQAKLTPFTLWAVDDDRPYEAKVFADKREMNKNELYLLDNAWPLSGAKVQTVAELFNNVDVNVTAMGARLGENGKSNYQLYDATSSMFIPDTYAHDQYLIAGRVDSGVGIPDILNFGINYSEITDSKDTGTYANSALDNYVGSIDAAGTLKFSDSFSAKLKAEFANSHYTNNKGFQNYISDNALKAGAEMNLTIPGFGDSKLNASYSAVGLSYTAYAAQTRIYNYNENINYPYLTQNSTWNIKNSPPSYILGGRLYPFTKYNPTINVSYGNASGASTTGLAYQLGNLLSFPIYENNTLPYGDSTPNRDAITIKYSGNYLDGLIQPSVRYIMANEIVSPIAVTPAVKPRNFSVIEAGLKSEFTAGIPFAATIGFKSEDTNNGQTNSIALTSNTVDAGLEATVIKKKLKVYAGYKNISYNGNEYVISGPYYMLTHFDNTINSIGAGFEYNIAKPAVIGMSYTTSAIGYNDAALKILNYNAQELDIKVSISF